MAQPGSYEEELFGCRGKLRVFRDHWEIYYYFPGPDLRYNGESVTIRDTQVMEFIVGFQTCWETFKKLQKEIPAGTEMSVKGPLGLSIKVGGFFQGIFIQGNCCLVDSETQLEKVITAYRYALDRAPKVQQFLASL